MAYYLSGVAQPGGGGGGVGFGYSGDQTDGCMYYQSGNNHADYLFSWNAMKLEVV